MLDNNLPPVTPGPIPPLPPTPLDPVALEAAFKVQQSPEYAELKSALGVAGRVTYQGQSYTAQTLDRLVNQLCSQVELRDQPSGANYIANQVRGVLKGLTESLGAPPAYRIGGQQPTI